ncbi:MAG: 3-deoxy-D-manno-octulosonic acid transferase [Nitrospirales bacterium]|nr:3-deoxy-D-manno-octulosonic acid transferase [Nitrospira sp.]MDR4502395.1 3-deoxy-D-manno-octulosonic acid transferase [Nitrospirales bacterium]
MGYLLYNILLWLASPFIILTLLAKPRCRRGLAQRLGRVPKHLRDLGAPIMWVHAVSLGEVTAAVPLVKSLHQQYPNYVFIVSTVTETGREAVEQRLAGVAHHAYGPLDFPWAVNAYVRHLGPVAYLFVETELWPNLLRTMFRRQIPAIMVNGRLSTDSFEHYRYVKKFMEQVLSCITLFLMQSERDAKRIRELGAKAESVHVTGNMKFDLCGPEQTDYPLPALRDQLGLQEHERLFIAGSTHPEEEDQLLRCYKRVCKTIPSLVLLIAPRHIERISEVEATVLRHGFPCLRKSQLADKSQESFPSKAPRVILLDTRGELASLYASGWVAFVGGTLVPVGGHNLLEPAQLGIPVLYGPYTDHCAESAKILREAGGGIEIHDEEELAATLIEAYHVTAWCATVGQAARQAVEMHRGVVQKNLALLGSRISSPTTESAEVSSRVSSSQSNVIVS